MRRCKLGGYDYPYNPVENKNPPVRAITVTETLRGRVFTDWGSDASRRDITQTWPTLDAAVYETLAGFVQAPGTLPFIDDDNFSYTVIAASIDYQRKTPGGDAYLGVTFKLLVVSSP